MGDKEILNMKIVDVVTEVFGYKSKTVRDSDGHTHPGPEHDARQSLLKIVTDEGYNVQKEINNL